MPTATRWFLRTALVHFVLALAAAALSAADGVWTMPALVGALRPVWFHLFMVGWVTQLIAGVAYWMFPKYSSERQRGHPAWPWLTYVPLNVGLALRAVAEPALATTGGPAWAALLAASAALQLAGALVFVAHLWGRVKER